MPASTGDRGEVKRLARTARAFTSDMVELARVDQGHTSERGTDAAARHGLVLLPERQVIKRSFT